MPQLAAPFGGAGGFKGAPSNTPPTPDNPNDPGSNPFSGGVKLSELNRNALMGGPPNTISTAGGFQSIGSGLGDLLPGNTPASGPAPQPSPNTRNPFSVTSPFLDGGSAGFGAPNTQGYVGGTGTTGGGTSGGGTGAGSTGGTGPGAGTGGTGTGTGAGGSGASPQTFNNSDDAFSAMFNALGKNDLTGYQNAAAAWMKFTGYNTLPVWAREEGWNPTTKQFGNFNSGVDPSQWSQYINPIQGQPSMADGSSDVLGNDWRQGASSATGINGMPGVYLPNNNTTASGGTANYLSMPTGYGGQGGGSPAANSNAASNNPGNGAQANGFLTQLASYLSSLGGGGNLLGMSPYMNANLGAYSMNPYAALGGGSNNSMAPILALLSALMSQNSGSQQLYSRSQYPQFP